jgi:hypothetical protein
MRKFVSRVAVDRAAGKRPGQPRALAAAVAVGGAAATITYRLLRHEAKR